MNCKLLGYVYRALEVTMDPGDEFYAERGAMISMDAGIDRNVETTGNGILNMISSKLSGESLLIVRYRNNSGKAAKLVLAGSTGGLGHVKITPGQQLILRCGDYVASSSRVSIDMNFSFNKFIRGTGFSFQKVQGDATVFFDCVDTLIERELDRGEELIVDENHLKAMLGIDDSRIRNASNGGIFSNLASGEGYGLTSIIGPGKVFLSSVPAYVPGRQ